jgi:Uma2 family endonuclease
MASATATTIDATGPRIDHPLGNGTRPASRRGDPTWEMAHLFPRQGEWTEEAYLALDRNWLIEFSDGVLEFLPMPTMFHQAIVDFLHTLLKNYVSRHGLGRAFFAPLPVRLRSGKYREPDVMFIRSERLPANLRTQPQGADLVMEVVSPGDENRERDLEIKPEEYAQAGIQEYWIVDPDLRVIRVLTLDGSAYRLHGEFCAGQVATSLLLEGFTVNVDEVFAAGETTQR